jgi:sterol desaturase/sphingolipid hydroxylase (fatty acid hydroxylase superfamily)
MEFLRWLLIEDVQRIRATFSAGGPYGAPALLGALLFVGFYYVGRRRARNRKVNLRAFVRSIFTKRILLHPSSFVDYRLWTINAIVLAAAYGLLAVGNLAIRNLVIAALTRTFGAHPPLAWPIWLVMGMATLFELLAYEFGYWGAHYVFHRVPWLWEFHKVHHSAEVMTTLTEMRQHPVEIIAFVNVITVTTGTVFGVMTYMFGPGVGHFTLFNGNIALMFFLLTWGHLRHSHIWIRFGGLAGRLFQSPAHHQIHHSTDPRHFDKNLGFALAVWDWAFGTLYIPAKTREVTEYGVGEARGDFDTATRSFIRPFVRAGEHFAAPGRPAPTPGIATLDAHRSGG